MTPEQRAAINQVFAAEAKARAVSKRTHNATRMTASHSLADALRGAGFEVRTFGDVDYRADTFSGVEFKANGQTVTIYRNVDHTWSSLTMTRYDHLSDDQKKAIRQAITDSGS
jgi:hypothetical protein